MKTIKKIVKQGDCIGIMCRDCYFGIKQIPCDIIKAEKIYNDLRKQKLKRICNEK